LSNAKKYTLDFIVNENELGRNQNIRDYIRYKNKDSSKYERFGEKPEQDTNSNDFILKIKRSNLLSLQVVYALDTQIGDCDFDTSICNYTSSLLSDSALASSIKNGQIVKHLPKFGSISINDDEMTSKSKDFYLSISKTSKNNEAIYSPLIRVQKEKKWYNKKMYTLSFSFMMPNKSLDQIELFLIKNRSDFQTDTKPRLLKEVIQKFSHSSVEKSEKIKRIKSKNVCLAQPNLSMANQFAPKSAASIGFDVIENWYRVSNINVFSCYDFRLGFSLLVDPGIANVESQNTRLEVGLDDIQLNEDDELKECSDNSCGLNGACFLFENKPVCCCKPGYEVRYYYFKIIKKTTKLKFKI
jgi:hypothetical protein